jgi:hypothetical protein
MNSAVECLQLDLRPAAIDRAGQALACAVPGIRFLYDLEIGMNGAVQGL